MVSPVARAKATRPSGSPNAELLLRRGLLVIAAAAAVTAALAGLARLNVLVAWGPRYAYAHGPLFVLGVFGTVIGLERAVALARGWGFAAPGLGAVACVAMLAGLSWAPWAAAGSALALLIVNAAIVRRQPAAFTWLMLLGGASLLVGSVRWAMGHPAFEVVPTWMAFFVLTITAERLELSRLAPTPRWAGRALVVVTLAFAVSAGARVLGVYGASRVFGVTMALLAAWQLRFDLARRTARQPGLPRFAALGVLLGAVWLLLAGVFFAWAEVPAAGRTYDAALHTVFIGYVLSMVFAHAPIILPAVARVELPFHPALYAPLAALHAGLLARVVGDLTGLERLRAAGAIANALTLGLFAAAVVFARVARRRSPPRPAPPAPRGGPR